MVKRFLMLASIAAHLHGFAEDPFIPNDPLFENQWGLASTGPYHIKAPEAWALEKGSKKIAIVVLDTGIDYTHPDLKNNMWINPNEIPGNGIDDDGNGYIDDVHGVNVITGSGDPMDDNGHGTFMAGIIGAEGNNGIGITGVMNHVSLIACKFLDNAGSGSTENAIKCLDYVADLAQRDIGVHIIATNNAWGGNLNTEALMAAIKKHQDLGILFVTSAGGEGLNIDLHKMYPASFPLDNIVVTTAMNSWGTLTFFANYGPNSVHIASPGQSILSTLPHGQYGFQSGSVATGFVSGVIGLMKSKKPDLSYQDLKEKIMKTASPLASVDDSDRIMSGGFIDAARCLID